jgi:hypothetical protein
MTWSAAEVAVAESPLLQSVRLLWVTIERMSTLHFCAVA